MSIYSPKKYESKFKYYRHQELEQNDLTVSDKNILNPPDEDEIKPNEDKRDSEIIDDDGKEEQPIVESDENMTIFGFDKKPKKIDDIREDHLRANANFYNQLFYSPDPAISIGLIKELPFLEYFYPNVKRLNLYSRMKGACGGLALDPEMYRRLGIRMPYSENKSNLTAVPEMSMEDREDLNIYIDANYDEYSNWYKVDAKDNSHIIFCCKLYSLMDEILNNPQFDINDLTVYHNDLLMEWQERVLGAADELKKTRNWYQLAQILHDLCWYPLDIPSSQDDATSCRIAFCNNMACRKLVQNMNEASELHSKEDTVAYLVKELDLGDECFLVPSLLLYPIINKGSIKMAMDQIDRVDPEYVEEYVKNLNKKYREFRCDFSISIDHPYAKYADKAIINNMTRVLVEGDTMVDDHGTSTGKEEVEPWYIDQETRRADGDVDHDFYPDRNLGPNVGKDYQKDFTKHYSIL